MRGLTDRPSLGNLIRPFNAKPVPGVSVITHLGEDYGWGNGFEVYAAASGRVFGISWSATRATNNRAGGYGNHFQIDHGDGLTTLYAHQPTSPMLVTDGEHVDGGQRVGTKGNTGNAAGAHLHFEARINGVPVNPAPLFRSSTASLNVKEIPDMTDEQANQLAALWQALVPGKGGYKTQGEVVATFSDTLAATQATLKAANAILFEVTAGQAGVRTAGGIVQGQAAIIAQVAALSKVVEALAAGSDIDPASIMAAAREGAEAALRGITFSVPA